MADNETNQEGVFPAPNDTPTPAPAPAPFVDPVNAQSKALAEAAVLAEKQKVDEGDEGGHYLIGDRHVNANGDPIKKSGKSGKWEVVKDGQ